MPGDNHIKLGRLRYVIRSLKHNIFLAERIECSEKKGLGIGIRSERTSRQDNPDTNTLARHVDMALLLVALNRGWQGNLQASFIFFASGSRVAPR